MTLELKNASNEEVIWTYLLKRVNNPYGVAGLMGNLYAESALKPTNLQSTYEKSLGINDQDYTIAVDNGIYNNFVKDKAGYGLAQWTYWTRKQALLAHAKSKGASIGDLTMQLSFLMKELRESYKSTVLDKLEKATSIQEASDIVLTKFERPADQSDRVKKLRASYGKKYYDKFAKVNNPTSSKNYKVGDAVKLKSTAKEYTNGVSIPNWVKKTTLYIRQIDSNGTVFLVSTEKTKKVYTGRVKATDVEKI